MTVNKKEYYICKKLGHVAVDLPPGVTPIALTCRYCGVSYQFFRELHEFNPPDMSEPMGHTVHTYGTDGKPEIRHVRPQPTKA